MGQQSGMAVPLANYLFQELGAVPLHAGDVEGTFEVVAFEV